MLKADLVTLFQSTVDGISTLHHLSESCGDDTRENYARILYYALGAYLIDRDILDGLALCGAYLINNAPQSDETVLPLIN